MKVGEGWVCWVQLANMWQHCISSAVQRETAFVEESWRPEFNLFGSMPWCSFPWRKHLQRLTQNKCYTVDSLNLIHEFTSLFRRSDFCRFAKESLPTEIGKGRQWTSVFFCGCASNAPRFAQGQPNGYFKWKNLVGQLNPLLEWMLNESWRRLSLLSSNCQHVATLQFDSCAEKDSLCGRVMMAWIELVWINAMVFHGTSTSQGWRKGIVIQSTV